MSNSNYQTIIVDFLNIGLIPLISKLDPNTTISFVYLFNSNRFVEKLIKFILKKKHIKYKFIPLNSKRTYKEQSNITDEITLNFLKKYDLKKFQAYKYLDLIIGNVFYKKIYRIISSYIFIQILLYI